MFTVEKVTDLMWCENSTDTFTCFIKYAEFPNPHPSAVNGTDDTPHIRGVWGRALAGEFGEIKKYETPTPELSGEVFAQMEQNGVQPVVTGSQTL